MRFVIVCTPSENVKAVGVTEPLKFGARGPANVTIAVTKSLSVGRTIWIADAHRDDGKRFVVRADEKLTAFVELESAIRTGREAVA